MASMPDWQLRKLDRRIHHRGSGGSALPAVLTAKMGLSRTVDDVVSMLLNHLNSSFVEMINEDSLLPRFAKVSSGTGFGAVVVGFNEIGVGDGWAPWLWPALESAEGFDGHLKSARWRWVLTKLGSEMSKHRSWWLLDRRFCRARRRPEPRWWTRDGRWWVDSIGPLPFF